LRFIEHKLLFLLKLAKAPRRNRDLVRAGEGVGAVEPLNQSFDVVILSGLVGWQLRRRSDTHDL
jgi:hypothetical protein